MDVARLNMSHGNREVHAQAIACIREAMKAAGTAVAIMLDTKGPEIRVTTFRGEPLTLKTGDTYTITTRPQPAHIHEASVPYEPLPGQVKPGSILLLDDGKLTIEVQEVAGQDVRCRVMNGGVLSHRKKLTLPGIDVHLPVLSDEDVADLRFGVEQGVDFVAASFVRNAQDVLAVRGVIEVAGGDVQVIAKIESHEGVDHLDEILAVADGVMVARGDMGVEYPVEEVPLIQKRIIDRCVRAGKPVVTATQMLESMIFNPRPTRAEASDVANAVLDGTDAIMLSAETATGEHPVEAVATMARIAERTDDALRLGELVLRPGPGPEHTITDSISHATCTTAETLGAAAIITATQSGHTARMVAKYRPRVPIVAATPTEGVARRLRLVWGVIPLIVKDKNTTDELITETVVESLQAGILQQGDLVVLTAGVPVGVPGSTNLLKVHTVGEILLRGAGLGQRVVKGRARLVRSAAEAAGRFQEGDILVVHATDPSLEPYMQKAAAIIAEEDGPASHAAARGVALGVPVIVGAAGATTLIEEGMVLTVDTPRGLIYRGEARIL